MLPVHFPVLTAVTVAAAPPAAGLQTPASKPEAELSWHSAVQQRKQGQRFCCELV
jgi:hypothetical protein